MLKRVHLALSRGQLKEAQHRLIEMADSIGNIRDIDFSPLGLTAWEDSCRWPGADRAAHAVLFSNLYLAFGVLLGSLGQYREAISALERGQRHTGDGAPHLARRLAIPLQLSCAAAALEQGALRKASDILDALDSSIDNVRDPGYRIERLECLGKLHMLRGNFGTAVQQYEQVVQYTRVHGFAHAELIAIINLGHIRVILNQTREAIELFSAALRQARVAGDHDIEQRANFFLAVARARGQSLADDVPIAPSVVEMWDATWKPEFLPKTDMTIDPLSLPQARSFLAFFEDRALGVHWYLGHHNAEAAAALLAEINRVFEDTDSGLIHLRLRVLAGLVEYYRGDWLGAERRLDGALASAREMDLKPELWQILRALTWSRARLGRPDPALATQADALLGAMTGSLEGTQRAIFLLNKWTADEEALASECNELLRLRAVYRQAPWYRKLPSYWSFTVGINRLMWRIDRYKEYAVHRELSPGADQCEPPSAEPSLFRRLLRQRRDRATIVFLVLPDRVVVIGAHGLRINLGISATTRIELRELVRSWHLLANNSLVSNASLQPDDIPAKDGTEAMLGRLTARLAEVLQLPSILSQLSERVRALTILPDDVLHGFPFAAIMYKGGPLVERFALSFGFESFQVISPIVTHGPANALLLGVTKGTESYEPLPGVRRELDRLRPILTGRGWRTIELLDEAVSKNVLLSRVPETSLVHVACHGTFEPDRPDCSGLVLISESGNKETLTLREISQLDLHRVIHVTLSSCWSADNFVLPGRWIISLPETLLRSGARSVLGCLWPVPDEFAEVFMEKFYRNLEHYPRDRALQLAQIECLRGNLKVITRETGPAPLWAGFRLYGEPGPLIP
jgi:tetratricopeptide (TPR) repeat protein